MPGSPRAAARCVWPGRPLAAHRGTAAPQTCAPEIVRLDFGAKASSWIHEKAFDASRYIGRTNTPSPTFLGSGAERFYLPAIWIWHFGLEVAPSFFGDFAEFSIQQSRKIRSFCPKRAVPSPTVFWEWRSRPPPWLFFCGRPTSAQIWRACVRARAAALGPALALKRQRHGEQVSSAHQQLHAF